MKKRRQEAQEEIARRKSELSTWEKEVTKQVTKLNKRTRGLSNCAVNMTVENRDFTRCRQELQKRVQNVQDELIGKTRKSLGICCAVEEELIDMAQ